jgi:hypothetical protein
MRWVRGFRRWSKHLIDSVRGRGRGRAADVRDDRDESLEREIERAHAMRVGEPLEQPSRH